ncbi:MAG: transposase [Bacteroidetes bacterium]|nr:transposase [Bacteroidota bacterium]
MTFNLSAGSLVKYQGETFIIVKNLDTNFVLLENGAGKVEQTTIDKLEPLTVETGIEISALRQEDWNEAKRRFTIIQKIINSEDSHEAIIKAALDHKVGESTIYRWLAKYKKTKLVSSLAPSPKTGGKGKSRLTNDLDDIIKQGIDIHYLDKQRKSVKKVITEISLVCKEKGIEPPHYNTIRARIAMISNREKIKSRLGREAAKKSSPKVDHFPDGIFPLSSVQIDHTPVDVIVVDEVQRKPIGRPWITLAIDTYSRMVIGFYLGFEKPSAMSVGLCLAQAILPKEEWLAQRNIFSEWPCWGPMKVIHMDNAEEFHSDMLKAACLEYHIEANFRPQGGPEFGGTIERMLGTLSTEIHSLEGTTFSNVQERGEYDSEGKAILTIKELEKWLLHLIVEVYPNRFHSSLNKTPLAKWKEGLIGDSENVGVGLPPRILNKRKVYIDFMPFEERTIQDYGVMIDNVCYYSDGLRNYIDFTDSESGKLKAKKKFIFKRDPRDISTVYFLDPERKEYFPIPYRDTSKPAITIWEFRAARDRLVQEGRATVNEDAIFAAYRQMKDIEQKSSESTKKQKRLNAIKAQQLDHKSILMDSPTPPDPPASDSFDEVIEAFEEIDDATPYK